jgi:hypothetical protein
LTSGFERQDQGNPRKLKTVMDKPETTWAVRTVVTLAWLAAAVVWVFALLTLAAIAKYVHMIWLSRGVRP